MATTTRSLADYWREANLRARELGLDAPEAQEAMRNRGASRTPEKRELLAGIQGRAEAAGLQPIQAYF